MSLNTQIRELIDTFNSTLPAEMLSLVEQGAGEISALSIVENALTAGDQAPNFSLKNYNGELRELDDYLRDGPVVLTFYRGLWCPYCNLQLAAYAKHLEEFNSLGASLVAVSAEGPDGVGAVHSSDMPEEAKNTVISNPSFDVLHDAESEVGKAFGLTFTLPTTHRELLKMMNLDIEKSTGSDSYTFSDPATYVIDKDGKIAWAFVPNNYRKRAEPEAIIAAINSL